jgi:hypothetical protein
MFALAALPAVALDAPQWPPPEGVAARMRELQQAMAAPEATPAQREAAREELARLLKSPAGQKSPHAPLAPRAAIEPFPRIAAPLVPVAPPPEGVARVEVVVPPRPIIVPHTGSPLVPRDDFAIDPRTGRVWKETPTGYIDPVTGRFIPR